MSITLITELYDGDTKATTVQLPAEWDSTGLLALDGAAHHLHEAWRRSLPPED